MIQVLPVVDQYSVFDEVKYVVKVGKVSDVDNLPPGQIKREKKRPQYTTFQGASQNEALAGNRMIEIRHIPRN